MSLKETTKRVKDMFSKVSDFSDAVVFDFGDDGKVSVDGGKSPPEVGNDDLSADCTIKVSLDDFNQILDGDLDPQMAFMGGKLSVDGNMGVAMNLVGILKG